MTTIVSYDAIYVFTTNRQFVRGRAYGMPSVAVRQKVDERGIRSEHNRTLTISHLLCDLDTCYWLIPIKQHAQNGNGNELKLSGASDRDLSPIQLVRTLNGQDCSKMDH